MHGGVLADRDIRRELALGNLVLFDPERDCRSNIQNCSVDITLGPYFYRNSQPIPYLNPWSAEHVQAYWGTVQKASVANDVATASKLGLAVGEYYLLLQPGESILGHTREFIGGRNHITCMVKARSSLGRTNVTVCRDAGMADIGYINRFTLEITNNGTSPLILPVGRRIGQIVFFYTGTPDTTYAGKYQQGATLEEVVTAWQPSMMLPKAYLDK